MLKFLCLVFVGQTKVKTLWLSIYVPQVRFYEYECQNKHAQQCEVFGALKVGTGCVAKITTVH